MYSSSYSINYKQFCFNGEEFLKTMMTSSNGNFFRVTGLLCGEFTGHREFPSQRSVAQSFDIFFDLRLSKRLYKQSERLWFETNYDVIVMLQTVF